jgi:hypothetical protein
MPDPTTPPRDNEIRIHVAVWGPWRDRLRPALALLSFALGLLLPVHLRWTHGALAFRPVRGGSLRTRGGTA